MKRVLRGFVGSPAAADGGKGGAQPRERTTWKIVLGVVLLIATPLRLFTVPNTARHLGLDLALGVWWIFVIWLVVTGGYGVPKPD
jgi:hypothetical protein